MWTGVGVRSSAQAVWKSAIECKRIAGLTARPTSRAGAKAGASDLVFDVHFSENDGSERVYWRRSTAGAVPICWRRWRRRRRKKIRDWRLRDWAVRRGGSGCKWRGRHAYAGLPKGHDLLLAGERLDPFLVVSGSFAQDLLGDRVDPLDVPKEVDDVLRAGQQRQAPLDDDAVETVVYKSQQAAQQTGRRFPSVVASETSGVDNKIIGQTTGGNPTGAGKDFHDLKVWQKAHQLTLAVYQLTARFPREEPYGLTTQIRRSSSSIAANLAEGCGRNGDAELARFCWIVLGSASELQYHLLLASDLHLLEAKDYRRLAQQTTEVKRMLTALLQKLNADR